MIGDKVAVFESGNRGTSAISSGKGDPGGASYGKYQLASNTGTLAKFLTMSGYDYAFMDLKPGTPEFNAKWKEMAQDQSFKDAEQRFMIKTHYEPLLAKVDNLGLPLSNPAVQEALFSMSVQHGGADKIVKKAGISENDDVSTIIDKLYKSRSSYVMNLGGLPASTKVSIMNRYRKEKEVVKELI